MKSHALNMLKRTYLASLIAVALFVVMPTFSAHAENTHGMTEHAAGVAEEVKEMAHDAAHDVANVAHHGANELHGSAHEEGSAGLPQLDPSTYPSQLFWLAVAFILLYIFFSKKTLPEVSSVVENRKNHIRNDLETAEQLKKEVEEAQHSYEKSLSGARSKATKAMEDANAKAADKQTKEIEAFKAKADQKISDIAASMEKARDKAMKDMDAIVAEVSKDAAQKIVGIDLDIKKAQTVVKALNSKKAA